MVSPQKLRSCFLALFVVLIGVAGFFLLSLLVCLEEPADAETQQAVLKAEPFESSILHQTNPYQEAIRLISDHHHPLMALAHSGSDEVLFALPAIRSTDEPSIPEPLRSRILTLIDPFGQGSSSILVRRDGRIKLVIKTREDSENYLHIVHSIVNTPETSPSIKYTKLGNCYYEITVIDAFNIFDPCNFSPN